MFVSLVVLLSCASGAAGFVPRSMGHLVHSRSATAHVERRVISENRYVDADFMKTFDDRYCGMILNLVDAALNEEPSRGALLSLLKIADPTVSDATLSDRARRQSALRSVKALIHPDRHPNDLRRATLRFQDAQRFYDLCSEVLETKGNRPAAAADHRRPFQHNGAAQQQFPLAFHVEDRWNFLDRVGAEPVLPVESESSIAVISKTVGFKCINYRGAIVHGKPTELCFNYKSAIEFNSQSVETLFMAHGGSMQLDSVEAIKDEIMRRGPVVSTSFRLTEGFLKASEHSGSFEASLVDRTHPLLIVGWKLSPFGDMWLARSTRGNRDIPIAVGQFAIDDEVLAPLSDFDQMPWQDDNQAFDLDSLSGVDWYAWSGVETKIKSNALEGLCSVLDVGLSGAFRTKKRFVLRDKFKKARSRWAYITNATWLKPEKVWKIEISFCE